MQNPKSNLASVDWLEKNLHNPDVLVLYTQMANPVGQTQTAAPNSLIPHSRYFDFENVFCNVDSHLPHTMPSAEHFTEQAQALGINKNSIIVIYDNQGIYCAPRVWWMFKSMGHEQVYVLNGGLPGWLERAKGTISNFFVDFESGDFTALYDPYRFIEADTIMANLQSINLLDARNTGRFNGTAPEPREGLRSGHAPGAINLPFDRCIEGYKLCSTTILRTLFDQLLLDKSKQMVFSCGSGVTACILALAASELGYTKLSVYDGSWSEWGGRLDLPVIR